MTPDLLEGINHITFMTRDMDRLTAFYERVFGAKVTMDLSEEGLRHTFIEVGPNTMLHPFQVPGVEPPSEPGEIFQRGRLDHFAFNAATEDAFREIRRRLLAEGATKGEVTDMGSLILMNFQDPDGGINEVVWMKPGVDPGDALPRDEWTTVEMDD